MGMQKRIKKDYVTMSWFPKEYRQGKEKALRALRKWKNKKTKENRFKYVQKRIQYKVITENKKKKWQEWNTENIKRLVDKKDNTQLRRGIRNLIQSKGRRYEIDPGRAREYFSEITRWVRDGIGGTPCGGDFGG
jgi:hypothetical protein